MNKYADYGFQFFVRGKPATREEFFDNLPAPHLGLAENIFLSWQQNADDFQTLHDKLFLRQEWSKAHPFPSESA